MFFIFTFQRQTQVQRHNKMKKRMERVKERERNLKWVESSVEDSAIVSERVSESSNERCLRAFANLKCKDEYE